jgi:hypothetical protein
MSPHTDTEYEAIELAQRTGDGLEVQLLWHRSDERLTVLVNDFRNDVSFAIAARNGSEALDAFRHPFAYATAGVTEAAVFASLLR